MTRLPCPSPCLYSPLEPLKITFLLLILLLPSNQMTYKKYNTNKNQTFQMTNINEINKTNSEQVMDTVSSKNYQTLIDRFRRKPAEMDINLPKSVEDNLKHNIDKDNYYGDENKYDEKENDNSMEKLRVDEATRTKIFHDFSTTVSKYPERNITSMDTDLDKVISTDNKSTNLEIDGIIYDDIFGNDNETSVSPVTSIPSHPPAASVMKTTKPRIEGLTKTTSNRIVSILGLFELSVGETPRADGASELAAARLAVDHVNTRHLLPGYRLHLITNDTKCDPGVGVDRFFHALYTERESRMVMLLGTACSEVTESIAKIVPYWNIVQVSFGSTSPALSDRSEFPLFCRTVAPDSSHNPARIAFIRQFGWDTVTAFSQNEEVYSLAVNELVTQLEAANITCAASITFAESDFKEQLQQLKITLVDHNGRAYAVRILRNRTEPATDTLDDTISWERLSIDLNDIKEIFMTLTDDQRKIIMHIYYMYKNNIKVCEENPKIILQGPAGTGKSTIINFIEKLITWEENNSSDSPGKLKVIKCAFTGKAASNIDGLTLHCMLSISIYNTRSLVKKRLKEKKELLDNSVFFICDEISMVGERLMKSVNMRLQQIYGNEKLYGDRFVLLVGDLYQIDPIQQKALYPNSPLWTCCKLYELTKIIRQQDEQFINALNNFRDSKLRQEDIDLLKSREIQDINQVPDSVIHLFHLNNPVDEYNTLKISRSNEREEIVNAIDDSEKWAPANLRVKIGIRYMITKNMDVGDGLANGTTGIVKDFDYDRNGRVSVIWMDFHSDVTGKKTRLDYLRGHTRPGIENWVPINRSSVLVKLKNNPKVTRTFGNMFPLKAAEAITVHKSQGQTYHDGVCVHITNHRYDKLRYDKSLQYVALTRVKRIEDLYIFGNLDLSTKQSQQFIKKEIELKRLRTERKLKLAYETFEDNIGDVIIFLNSGSTFNEHYQFIATDKWYGNGSLLIFTETNTIRLDEIEIPKFEIVYRSDYDTVLRSGGGIVCYKEASKSVEVISSMKDDDNNTHLTLLLYENYLYIVTGVKGVLNDDDFTRAIVEFITQYVLEGKCLFFIGNFNPNTAPLTEFLNDMNIRKKKSCHISDTNEGSQYDMVLTRNYNIGPDHFGFYEYIPSSHKPIYVKLPPRSELELISTPIPTDDSVDDVTPGTSQQHDVQERMEED